MPRRIGLVTVRRTHDAGVPANSGARTPRASEVPSNPTVPQDAGALVQNPATLLLDDFADALIAYARMYSAGRPGTAHPPLVRTTVDADGPRRISPALRDCDSVVFAFATPAGGSARGTTAACEPSALDACASAIGSLAAGTRMYALIALTSAREDEAIAAGAACRCACEHGGVFWGGAVAVTEGSLVPRLVRAPRLGMWRRPVSQAIDRLVAAVRMGCALDEVEAVAQGELFDPADEPAAAGSEPYGNRLIVASPHPLWCAVARRLG